MAHIDRTVTTKQPTERVWDYLSDFRSTNDWDPGTVTTERTSGDGGVGTVYENTSKFLGNETQIVYTVIEVDPGRQIVLRGDNDSVTTTDTITVEPDDGAGTIGTRVNYRAEFEFHGAAKLATPLAPLALKKLGDDAESNLQEALDRL